MARPCLWLGWMLISVVLSMQAQQAPSDAATKEDVLRLFDVMQIRQQMRQIMESVSQQTKAMTHATIRKQNPQITDPELARMDQIADESMKDFPIEGMLEDVLPVYQKHLTKTDVAAMIGFYSSGTGKKLLNELPAITAESMEAMSGRLQSQMETTMRRIEQMVESEKASQKKGEHTEPKAVPKQQ